MHIGRRGGVEVEVANKRAQFKLLGLSAQDITIRLRIHVLCEKLKLAYLSKRSYRGLRRSVRLRVLVEALAISMAGEHHDTKDSALVAGRHSALLNGLRKKLEQGLGAKKQEVRGRGDEELESGCAAILGLYVLAWLDGILYRRGVDS